MKHQKLDNNFVQWENGNIGHRSTLKIVLNPLLRFIQPWTNNPLVIVSIGTIDKNGDKIYTKFHGYKLARMTKQ